ncbi:MAG: hypothetical protein AAFZ01_06605, partial [Pseudomonadota bacterium]
MLRRGRCLAADEVVGHDALQRHCGEAARATCARLALVLGLFGRLGGLDLRHDRHARLVVVL